MCEWINFIFCNSLSKPHVSMLTLYAAFPDNSCKAVGMTMETKMLNLACVLSHPWCGMYVSDLYFFVVFLNENKAGKINLHGQAMAGKEHFLE